MSRKEVRPPRFSSVVDGADSADGSCPTGVSPRNRSCIETVSYLLFAVVTAATVWVGLRQTFDVGAHPRHLDGDEGRGGGIIVRETYAEVWLSDDWKGIETLADRIGRTPSHEEFVSAWTAEMRGEPWYVVLLKGEQVNGDVAVRRMIRGPIAQPQYFDEFRDLVRLVATGRRELSGRDMTETVVRPIPDEYRELTPAELHARLLEEAGR